MTPVLLCATKHSSSTTLYYKVLLQYCSVLQWTIPVLLCATKTTPVLLQGTDPVLLRATKYYSSIPKILHGCDCFAIPGTAHPPSTRSARLRSRQKPPPRRWRWGMEHLLQWNTWRWWLDFFYQWKMFGGWKVGWVWLGLLGRFPVSIMGFFGGCPGRNTLKRQSWEVLFKKSEDENGTRQKKAMWSGGKSPFLSIILNISSHIWGWWSLPPIGPFCIFVFETIHKLAVWCCLKAFWEESFVCSTSWCGDPWVDRTW